MDFEDSVQRLARDQSKIRGRARASNNKLAISAKAKAQAEYQRKQAARKREQREREERLKEYQKEYMNDCDRSLYVQKLSSSLTATSIHGEGDKIALPPSVLETLTKSNPSSDSSNNNIGNPWTFRIGILNPNYEFPASVLIKTLKPPKDDEYDDDDDDMSDDNDDNYDNIAAYQDELSYKYPSYTHCTVVEFTQEEGHVGIPQPIAKALLTSHSTNTATTIPTTRTVDPAGTIDDDDDTSNQQPQQAQQQQDQTPGHLAWGAFDIPSLPLEITLLKLPKGKACTLVPTKEALTNNFYGLKDVKLVLEQSLIRTRATLSLGDTVSTWHRGVQFDLQVTKLTPSAYHAVTCINTDIEVEIGASKEEEEATKQQPSPPGHTLGGGSSSTTAPLATTTTTPASSQPAIANTMEVDLKPEPPVEQTQGVCLVQIQHSGGTGRRRFDIQQATMQDLFAFSKMLLAGTTSSNDFSLVTRFPRRVFRRDDETFSKTLANAGISQGQERFMVEFQ